MEIIDLCFIKNNLLDFVGSDTESQLFGGIFSFEFKFHFLVKERLNVCCDIFVQFSANVPKSPWDSSM